MKNSTIVKMAAFLAIIMFGYANVFGQTKSTSVPADFQQHPDKNGAGYATDPAHIDSLTVGATGINYFVMPDPAITGESTFGWTKTGPASDATPHATISNQASFNFASAGTGTISVIETSTATCAGSSTVIDYEVIAAPDVTAASFSALACPSGTNGSYTVPGPTATLTIDSKVKGNKQVAVVYTLTGPAGFTSVGNTSLTLNDGNSVDLSGINLTHAGTYTLRIVSIVDRISTKSGVTATINKDYTFTLNRAPVTGPIYHLPNM